MSEHYMVQPRSRARAPKKFVVLLVIVLALYFIYNLAWSPTSNPDNKTRINEQIKERALNFSKPINPPREIVFKHLPLVTKVSHEWTKTLCSGIINMKVTSVSLDQQRIPVVVYKCNNKIVAVAVDQKGSSTIFSTPLVEEDSTLKVASWKNILIIATSSRMYEVVVVNVSPGAYSGKIIGMAKINGLVSDMSIDPMGEYLAVNYGDAIQVYKLPLRGKESLVLWKIIETNESNAVLDTKITSVNNETIIIYSDKQEVHAVNLRGEELWHYNENTKHRYGGLLLQPNGDLIAVGTITYRLEYVKGIGWAYVAYPAVRVLNASNGKLVWGYNAYGWSQDTTPPLAWSPEGNYLAAGFDGPGLLKIFTSDGVLVNIISLGESALIEGLSWSPNGTHIAISSDCAAPLPHPEGTPYYNCSGPSVGAWVVDLNNRIVWRRTTIEVARLGDRFIPLTFVWINNNILFYRTKLEMYEYEISSGEKLLEANYGDFAAAINSIVSTRPTSHGGIVIVGYQSLFEARVIVIDSAGRIKYTVVYTEPLGVLASLPENAISPDSRIVVINGINVTGPIPYSKISIIVNIIDLINNVSIKDVVPVHNAISGCTATWSQEDSLLALVCPDSSTSTQLIVYDLKNRVRVAQLRPLPGEYMGSVKAAFSPDSNNIAYYAGHTVVIVDYKRGAVRSFNINETGYLREIAWINNTSIAVLTDDALYIARVEETLAITKITTPWISRILDMKVIKGNLYLLFSTINTTEEGKYIQVIGIAKYNHGFTISNITVSLNSTFLQPSTGVIAGSGDIGVVLDMASHGSEVANYGLLIIADYLQGKTWQINLAKIPNSTLDDVAKGIVKKAPDGSIFIVGEKTVVKVGIKSGIYHANISLPPKSLIAYSSGPEYLALVSGRNLLVYKQVSNTEYKYAWGIRLLSEDSVILDPARNRILVWRYAVNNTLGQEVPVKTLAFFDYNGSIINIIYNSTIDEEPKMSPLGTYFYTCKFNGGTPTVIVLDYNGKLVLQKKIKLNTTGFSGFDLNCYMMPDESALVVVNNMYGRNAKGQDIEKHLITFVNLKHNSTRTIELQPPKKEFKYVDFIPMDNGVIAVIAENYENRELRIIYYNNSEIIKEIELKHYQAYSVFYNVKGQTLISIPHLTNDSIVFALVDSRGKLVYNITLERKRDYSSYHPDNSSYLLLISKDKILTLNLDNYKTRELNFNLGTPVAITSTYDNGRLKIILASSRGLHMLELGG